VARRGRGNGRAGETERAYAALRHRDYRLLWGAELVSSLGTQVQRVAIAWQVFQLTGDPLQLGLLGLFRFAPILLFGLAGGVVADRGDRRRTLLASQLALMATAAALAALTAAGSVGLPAIYALTFLSASFSAVAGPTRQALVPGLVPRSSLTGAMTMNILAMQVAAVSGPAIGGVLVGQVGLTAAYVVDALSFVAVIGALLAMRTPVTVARSSLGGLAAAVEGLRFLRGSPILLGVMALDFLATFFGASTVLMPIFAEEILGIGATGLGLLLAAPAAGAVAGSAVMGIARMPRRPGLGVLVAVAVYGACIAGFGLSRDLWLSLALLAGSGAADAASMALRHAVRTLTTPDALRGRIAAAHSTFAMGGPQLGEFEAGVVAAVSGAGTSVFLGGLGTLLAAGLVAWRVPAIAAYRTEADPPPGAVPERSASGS
jgi:MFS family permease